MFWSETRSPCFFRFFAKHPSDEFLVVVRAMTLPEVTRHVMLVAKRHCRQRRPVWESPGNFRDPKTCPHYSKIALRFEGEETYLKFWNNFGKKIASRGGR